MLVSPTEQHSPFRVRVGYEDDIHGSPHHENGNGSIAREDGRPVVLGRRLLWFPQKLSSGGAEIERPQLHRVHFTGRIRLEETLRRVSIQLFTFILLLGTYTATLLTSDDTLMISEIHQALRTFYGVDQVDSLHHPDEIMNYIQAFILQSYEMASALVDANTLDSIDVVRCFDEEVNDVCRLKYWSMPTDNSSAPNYLDLEAFFADTLSPFNVNPSAYDCSQPNPVPNCIDRSDSKFINESLTRPTFGLLPEQPIVFNRRLSFPYASVVPLTPAVWQTRSPSVACDELGNRYNTEVMRPPKLASTYFHASKSSPHTGRMQDIFLSYADDALTCIDRSKLVDSTFFDRSWHPWATYEEMKVGQPTTSVLFDGKPVYYKFVSDVGYLQAPVLGAVRLTRDPCADGAICENLSQREEDCVDPLQAGPDHPVWLDSPDLTYKNCFPRKVWDMMYLNTPSDSWSDVRENTFFTIETSEFNVASLVITPQMAAVADIVTLVRISFTVEQSGYIHGSVALKSSSEKLWAWYFSCSLVLLTAIIYLTFTWAWCFTKDVLSPGRWTKVYDTLICLGCSAHIICSLIIELSTPQVSDVLMTAFKKNSQQEYFSTVILIDTGNDTLTAVRTYGFVVMALLFCRVCLFASLHPRLAVMVNTLARSSDDLLHFVIYMSCVEVFFALFAHWAFGQKMAEYDSVSQVFWTQFRTAIGDFDLTTQTPDDPLFTVYVVTYVFVVFILMLNLLLAIVVEAYMSVKDSVKENKSENSVVWDVLDVMRMLVLSRVRRWPSSALVWCYLSTDGQGMSEAASSLPAVTAEELLRGVRKLDGSRAFESLEDSKAYCNLYIRKVREDGVYTLRETRPNQLLNPDQSFDRESYDCENGESAEPLLSPQRFGSSGEPDAANHQNTEDIEALRSSSESCGSQDLSDTDPQSEDLPVFDV